MAKAKLLVIPCFLIIFSILTVQTTALVPYTRSPLWDLMNTMMPFDDPFRILEQTPLTVPKGPEATLGLALARADWKETPVAHVITLDVPGMKKEDVKIEVEENRVLRISGERKEEAVEEGSDSEKWHRAERINGRFWRQFRLPGNADLEQIKAHLENGVLRITIPKFAEEKRRQPKVVDIKEERAYAQDIKASKAEL